MGIRVIKTALAAVLAIYAAGALQLEFALSAGLLAILGVDVTRKKSLLNAFVRIMASVVGLLFAIFIFYLFGFHIWVVALYIIIAYPVLARVNLKDGIVTSSVIMLHVFSEKSLGADTIVNEIALLLLGLGSATVLNLIYMPSWEGHIRKQRTRTEEAMSRIFMEIAKHLRDPAYVWDGQQLIEAEKAIEEGKTLAERASDNAIFVADNRWLKYFSMRERQMEAIQRMLVLLARVYEKLPYGQMTAELFEELSGDVKNEYYTGAVEAHLMELEREFKNMPLPSTREEFETRSAILQICLDLGHYMSIAKQEKKKRITEKKVSQ
ncbi:aromatic acid exporter family protein [Paenibacillus alkalitolerans]|uniref:aromatic acid exporter family protein n=1 Tax=Paenibacillus alkalitolerans TaxID=2799335 RepID=UPI0018F4C631|nr:aromatic acid exporter family protein [Paenibacillus alkalitolerans]